MFDEFVVTIDNLKAQPSMQAYPIPEADHQVEEVIKNSRFITRVFKLTSFEDAKNLVQQQKIEFPDARHHCYAFIAGSPTQHSLMGFSDDGEPSGTAGKPMLAVLQGSGIGHILAVSIRYFGGTKLGTGGLVKAYAGGVKLALASLATQVYVPKDEYKIGCDYRHLDQINYWLAQASADIITTDFTDKVWLTVAIADNEKEELMSKLGEMQLQLEPREA
ncbi:YigZ family protein [Catenovulum maritimum]|nr:YigZ family protein [Catenovulum maritimum]